MATRLVHAVAAILTMILLFIRQRCAVQASASRSANKGACAYSCGTSSRARLAQFSAECVACAHAAACYYQERGPKYKRDPEITLDNESLG